MEDSNNDYPLTAYNFRVSIDGMDIGFSEVSGLVREYETLTYRHGMSFISGEQITKFPMDHYSEVTLTRGITQNREVIQKLHEWLNASTIFDVISGNRIRKPVTVSLCDENGIPVVTWKIMKALLTKLEVSSLQADSNEVALNTLTLMAAGISIEHSS